MPKVEFEFDLERDIWNIWDTANSKSRFSDFKSRLPPEIIKIAEGKDLSDCKEDIKKYNHKIYNSTIIPIFLDAVSKAWNSIGKQYFKRLEEITKKQIYSKEFKAYLTTIPKCPYNDKENWFMISLSYSLPQLLMTCAHEIMHLQFHYYFWKDIEKQIGHTKTADLKEALTVLLNLEFNDLILGKDWGYELHKDLREFISNEWKKEKDFDKLLKKCVSYLE